MEQKLPDTVVLSLERLLEAAKGGDFELVAEEELARRWAWRICHFSTFLGLLVFFLFPTYSVITGVIGGLLESWISAVPLKLRLLTRFDEKWIEQLFTSPYPLNLITTSIGGCRFLWEYQSLPRLRRITDNIISAPLKWPWTLAELLPILPR